MLFTIYFQLISGGCIEINAAASNRWLPRVRKILNDYEVTGATDKELIDIIDSCNGSARKILLAIRKIIYEDSKKVSKSWNLLSITKC